MPRNLYEDPSRVVPRGANARPPASPSPGSYPDRPYSDTRGTESSPARQINRRRLDGASVVLDRQDLQPLTVPRQMHGDLVPHVGAQQSAGDG